MRETYRVRPTVLVRCVLWCVLDETPVVVVREFAKGAKSVERRGGKSWLGWSWTGENGRVGMEYHIAACSMASRGGGGRKEHGSDMCVWKRGSM